MLNGIDLTYRYQPLDSAVYQGVVVGTELFRNSERFALRRRFEAGKRQSYGGYGYAELKLNKKLVDGISF